MTTCPDCSATIYGRHCPCGWKPEKKAALPYQPYKSKKRQPKGRPELHKEARKLMHDRLNDRITTFELTEKMFEMDKKYPGVGFDDSAHKILKDWEARVERDKAVSS